MRADGVVPMRRSAVTNRYVTSYRQKPEERRFLIIPELRQGERWQFRGIIDNPFFKHGPFLVWHRFSTNQTCMINRQLFYMMMTGRMQ